MRRAAAPVLAAAATAASRPGAQVPHTLTVTDPDTRLGEIDRAYQLALPYSAEAAGARTNATAYPLLLYLHGQLADCSTCPLAAAFSSLGATKGFITVAPQGLADGFSPKTKGGAPTAWSVKAEGRSDVCKRESPEFVMASCKTARRVSNCNWATCYDDVHFIKTLLQSLQEDMKLPIDRKRIYMAGPSNGAMMIDYLAIQMPGVFAAAVPWYGAFLQPDYLTQQNYGKLAGTSLMALHGLQDTLIPPSGGEDGQAQYLYVPETATTGAWAAANGCSSEAVAVSTAWSGGDGDRSMRNSCVQNEGCKGGAAVMYCTFPKQGHGFWPSFGQDMTWWFLSGKVLAS